MKAIYAGLSGVVDYDQVKSFQYNCKRSNEEIEYHIPVKQLNDVQIYVSFGNVKPTAFEIVIIDMCNITPGDPIMPCGYVLGKDAADNWYGLFRFEGVTAYKLFSFGLTFLMENTEEWRYFSEAYQLEASDCRTLMKLQACYPGRADEFGFDTNEIWTGVTTDPINSLGNILLRYINFLYVRKGKIQKDAHKLTFVSNRNINFKTTLDRTLELRCEFVPDWYKEYILAVYSRGFISVDEVKYQVSTLNFEGLNDNDLTWKPYAKLIVTKDLHFGCDNTECIPDCNPTEPFVCCSPEVISAETEALPSDDFIYSNHQLTIAFTPCSPAPVNGYQILYRILGDVGAYRDGGSFIASPAIINDTNLDPKGTRYEGIIKGDCGVDGFGPDVDWETPVVLACDEIQYQILQLAAASGGEMFFRAKIQFPPYPGADHYKLFYNTGLGLTEYTAQPILPYDTYLNAAEDGVGLTGVPGLSTAGFTEPLVVIKAYDASDVFMADVDTFTMNTGAVVIPSTPNQAYITDSEISPNEDDGFGGTIWGVTEFRYPGSAVACGYKWYYSGTASAAIAPGDTPTQALQKFADLLNTLHGSGYVAVGDNFQISNEHYDGQVKAFK